MEIIPYSVVEHAGRRLRLYMVVDVMGDARFGPAHYTLCRSWLARYRRGECR